MAAPVMKLRTPTGTGANAPLKSANGSRASRRGAEKPKNLPKKRKSEDAVWRLPLVGDDHLRTGQQKKTLTGDGPLMEAAPVRERLKQKENHCSFRSRRCSPPRLRPSKRPKSTHHALRSRRLSTHLSRL